MNFNLYARGASDMKGQVMATLKAVEAILSTGGLPVNVKFLFEGKEEIGSLNLEQFIFENRELLTCDFALNPDTGMIGADKPTMTYALRGLAYFEIRISGPDHDLHSGMFGGVVHNPAQVLCELIAGMHNSQGRVTFLASTTGFDLWKQKKGQSWRAYRWMRGFISHIRARRRCGARKDTHQSNGWVPGLLCR